MGVVRQPSVKLGHAFQGILGLLSLAWVVAISWFDLWLLHKLHLQLQHILPGQPLHTAVALVCLIPFTLAGWAVPLGVAYRLLFDRRVPAALPIWRRDHRVGLVADYKSPFWRGYTTCFVFSLVLIPIHLLGPSWSLLLAELVLLALAGVFVSHRQWRRNRDEDQQVVIDRRQQSLTLPALGRWSWSDLTGFGVETEVVVSPRRDTMLYWVTLEVDGTVRRWKSFPLWEQAEQVARWLEAEISRP
jgi:hypothetical protein